MNIEHKLEPIEHWIVDGKAYRMATEQDVGKECYRSNYNFNTAVANGITVLHKVDEDRDMPYIVGCRWKYAYIQDDSLLTPQRTPVPALGDGWYLLRDDEVLQKGDKISGCGIDAHGVTWLETSCVGMNVGMWRGGIAAHCCARYFGQTEDPEIEPGPTEEPPTEPIDWTKPVRTKDGRAVRVLCADGPGDYPVVGIVDGDDCPEQWTLNGKWMIDDVDELDLENVPSRIQLNLWVNVYPNGNFYTYRTRESADASVGGRFACVKITIDCKEGDGL